MYKHVLKIFFTQPTTPQGCLLLSEAHASWQSQVFQILRKARGRGGLTLRGRLFHRARKATAGKSSPWTRQSKFFNQQGP